MASRATDNTAVDQVRRTIVDAEEIHQWQRPVAQGLLSWLTTEQGATRTHAIELLGRIAVPADGWGHAEHPDAPHDSTLASEVAEAAATFLIDDDDAESSLRTADLLRSWLLSIGDHTTPSGQSVSAVIAHSIAQTAHTCLELATAASRILPDLQLQDATTCVTAIAGNLRAPETYDGPLGDALAEVLLTYLRWNTDDPDAQAAAQTCLTTLTTSLAAADARGAFARRHLPAVMSTDTGRAAGPTLTDLFMGLLGQPHHALTNETLASVYVLLHDPGTRANRLNQVLQQLYGWMNTLPAPRRHLRLALCCGTGRVRTMA